MAQYHFLLAATTLVFLLVLSPTATYATSDSTVLDTDGNPLVPGDFYYVMPQIIQNGGGLTTIPVGSPACPGYFLVSKLRNRNNRGIPVAFFPKNADDKDITLSSDVNVVNQRFYTPSPVICALFYSRVWSLKTESTSENVYVTLGGVQGVPKAHRSWFQIEKNELFGGYKIVYRPSPTTRDVPGDVTVVDNDNGEGVLGLDTPGNALVFSFVKASTEISAM